VPRAPMKPATDPDVYWQSAVGFSGVLDESLVADIENLLDHFDGEETCKRLFWEMLSFNRIRQPLRTTMLPRSVRDSIDSLEIFASGADLTLFLAGVHADLDHHRLERMCRALTQRFPLSLVLVHEPDGNRWTLAYPDITKKAFLRLLPLPGEQAGHYGTARALAALEAVNQETGEPVSWLMVAERLELFFPGGTPGRRDDLLHIAIYVRDVSRFPLLTRAQERGAGLTSGQRPPDGCGLDYQRWRLIVHNLRYVVFRALQLPRLGMQLEDLVQEGNLGLIRAAELYDPQKGTRFLTYAHYWIRQCMLRSLSENCNLIRWPAYRARELLRRNRQGETEALHPGERTVVSLRRSMFPRVVQLRADQFGSKRLDGRQRKELREAIDNALATLPYRQREIIRLRFGIGDGSSHTLEEVGEIFGMTRERVRQIEVKALERLQHPVRLQALRNAFG